MHVQRAGLAWLLILLLAQVGCNKNEPTATEAELPDWLTESSSASNSSPFGNDSAVLGLNLKQGEQFPLKKIVEQELTQKSLSGTPEVSKSRVELMFAVKVEEIQGDRKKLRVRYERIRYSHQVADERVHYDSTDPPPQLPVAVQAYHDMIGDGFAFWLGPENQIVEVEGFTEFVNRSLRNVPEELKTQVVLGVEAGTGGENGIANFVDNAIGLLPVSQQQSPGDSWERMQSVQRPIPMHVHNQYTLKELTDSFAIVNIAGSITPSTSMTHATAANGVRVTVTGGQTTGTCTIFRETGLPKESRVEQNVDMSVLMSGAIEFQQQKRTVTTIESFPTMSTANPTVLGLSQEVEAATPPRQ